MPNPTITASVQPGAGPSKDTFVSSLNPTTSYYANSYLHVGNHETLGMTRAFIKFNNLPSLQPFAKIINAYLEVYMYLAVGSDSTVIEAHQITSDWQSSTTTWNVQPTYRSTPESSIASSANGWWQFDITSLVQRWYSLDQDLYGASSNYGVMLKAANEMTPRRSFYSGDYTIDLTEDPKLVITYEVDPIGLEDFWKYDNNVNVYNGNYVLSEADVTLPGRGVPITVTRAYNSRAFSPAAYPYGYGWTLDVARHINYTDDGAITYTTEDGNKYVFVKNTSGNYDSPAGVSLVFAKESGIYVITDPSGIKYYFNNNGKLYNTVDTSNNITTISYNANGTINTITDPSGRLVSFNYTNGKLTSIKDLELLVQLGLRNLVFTEFYFSGYEVLVVPSWSCFIIYCHNLENIKNIEKIVNVQGLFLRPCKE
jgi:YD repeat-containing protein